MFADTLQEVDDGSLHHDVIQFLEAGRLFFDLSGTLAILVGFAALHKFMQVFLSYASKKCDAGSKRWRLMGTGANSPTHLIVARLHCCKCVFMCCF